MTGLPPLLKELLSQDPKANVETVWGGLLKLTPLIAGC